MMVIIAAALFAVFVVNLVLGAFGGTPFLSDVGEMLLLLATVLFFVILVLQREAQSKKNDKTHES
ncbi:MAG: hypothetical protein AAGC92_11185 [Pseudomonadota bacterium]